MNNKNLFALSLAAAMSFAGCDDAGADTKNGWRLWQEKPPVANSMVIPGNERVGGSLSGLTRNGRPLANDLQGQYLLVYFGTPYRMPTCAPDLAVISEAVKMLEERHGKAVASRVTPVFIHPPHDPARQPAASNLTSYAAAPGSRFAALTGTHRQVMDVAAQYRARYIGGDGDQGGVYANHTRFAYLMGPDGKNLAIFPGDMPYVFMTDQLVLNLTRDGVIGPHAGAAPGADR